MEAIASNATKGEVARIKATIAEYFEEMKRLNADTARLQAESKALAHETRAKLDRLKADIGHVEAVA